SGIRRARSSRRRTIRSRCASGASGREVGAHVGISTITKLIALTALLLAPLLAAEGQDAGRSYRVGSLGLPGSTTTALAGLWKQHLREKGWIEDKNIHFEQREATAERFPEVAAE